MKRSSAAGLVCGVLIAACVLPCIGCQQPVPMSGAASCTLLTRDLHKGSPKIELVGPPVEKTETCTWYLIFGMRGKMPPTHESLLARILEDRAADVLLDADLTTTTDGIPYIFMRIGTKITGQPARFVKGGAK